MLRCFSQATFTTGRSRGLFVAIATIVPLMSGALAETPKEKGLKVLRSRYAALHSSFAMQLLDVATLCEQAGFAPEAEQIRARAVPYEQLGGEVDKLPVQVIPEPSLDLPEPERAWRLKFLKAEADYAAALYKLCRDALKVQYGPQPSLAFSMLREVAFRDPNHVQARALLGYVRDGDEWTTPFIKRKKTAGYMDHPQFGWIRARDQEKYEAGERPLNGRWVSIAREAATRADFNQAWEIETEHFEIRTNHSLEAGVQIGRELELFHQFFIREFAPFFNTTQTMQMLFDKGTGGNASPRLPHRIYYFRSRDEYVAQLKAKQPQIEITNGLYIPEDRIAYLYHDPQRTNHMATIFHEVTHQLLGETTRETFAVGEAANFWLIEGFACYIETVRKQDDVLSVGTPRDDRIWWARERVVKENFFVPMQQFTALGKDPFRASPGVLPQYYSQAAGMVHFFLHYNEGEYRDAFLEHLSQVYSSRTLVQLKAPPLDKQTGVPFAELDLQYRKYISDLPVE